MLAVGAVKQTVAVAVHMVQDSVGKRDNDSLLDAAGHMAGILGRRIALAAPPVASGVNHSTVRASQAYSWLIITTFSEQETI